MDLPKIQKKTITFKWIYTNAVFFKETDCINSFKREFVLEDLLKNYLHLNIAVRL